VATTFSQLILLDVVNDLAGSNQTGHFQNLINRIVTNKERCLLKDLYSTVFTIPARIRPADQMSTL
jgi:hypothetical protein